VEQNYLHLVTFASLVKIRGAVLQAVPQPQNMRQNSKCDLLRRDEIGNTPQ
jgi:hypothetical protein